jgi:antimicrobial peptide system SdpA family protein
MSSTSRARRAAVTFIATTAAIVVVAMMSVLGNKFPSNVFSPTGPEGVTKSVSMVFLQGWGFFTRDAREDRVSLAAKRTSATGWEILDQDAIFQSKYAFGLSRLSRAESVDINVLYSSLAEDVEWTECSSGQRLAECISRLKPVARVGLSPIRPDPLCSSDLALVRETPIPFGYRDLTRKKQTFALAISVGCDG